MNKRDIQESEYIFPYHHIPSLASFSPARLLSWSHEYLSYLERILEVLHERSFTSLVDVGCGDGRLLAELSTRSNARLVGTDFSDRALAFARAFAPTVEFTNDIPENELFEAFTLIEVLEHIPPESIDTFFKNLKTHLTPGAFGIVTVPHVNMPLNPKHYQHFTEELGRKVLEPHFTILRVEHLNAEDSLTRILSRLFSNRFFILNHASVLNRLYRWYTAHYLIADKKRGTRLLFLVENKATS